MHTNNVHRQIEIKNLKSMHEKSIQYDIKFLTAGVARLLLSELLEHLASTGDPVTTLANGDVQNQFIDLNRAHDIVLFRLSINRNAVSH